MDGSASAFTAPAGSLALALGAWLGAMLLGGLMTAHYRVSGLHANGLLEKDNLGPVLRDMVEHPRRFQVATGTLYLLLTLLGGFAWGSLLRGVWVGETGTRFYLVYALAALLLWSLGGLAFKRLAAGTVRSYARAVGGLIYPLSWLLRPWAALLLMVMDRLDDTLWAAEAQPHLSAGEIRSLISEDGHDATLEKDEREMIESIFAFHDRAVREIMVPRIDMVALDGDADVAASLPAVIEEGHSRIPVYRGGVDRIIGILYSKDLLGLVEDGRFTGGGRTLAELVRPAYFVPESKKIDEVLDEFRSKRIHMAVVIDEYGGTAGLVTLEDVIEEIVGEIEDEFDEEETLAVWLDERRVRLDPKIDLDELEEVLGVTLGHAEGAGTSETLGGLIYEAAGNVPDQGDRVVVGGYRITVERVEDQRLVSVLLEADAPLPGHARQGGA